MAGNPHQYYLFQKCQGIEKIERRVWLFKSLKCVVFNDTHETVDGRLEVNPVRYRVKQQDVKDV